MALLVSACSSSAPPGFSLASATVDASYSCPKGSSNSPYDLHGTVQLRNPTPQSVTVEAVRADLTLEAVNGGWLEKIGDMYQVDSSAFGPGMVGAGANVSMRVTIPSACTNGKNPAGADTYGDYRVRLHVVTTAGTYSIAADHFHRITAA